jgi:hypothetical protein
VPDLAATFALNAQILVCCAVLLLLLLYSVRVCLTCVADA